FLCVHARPTSHLYELSSIAEAALKTRRLRPRTCRLERLRYPFTDLHVGYHGCGKDAKQGMLGAHSYTIARQRRAVISPEGRPRYRWQMKRMSQRWRQLPCGDSTLNDVLADTWLRYLCSGLPTDFQYDIDSVESQSSPQLRRSRQTGAGPQRFHRSAYSQNA